MGRLKRELALLLAGVMLSAHAAPELSGMTGFAESGSLRAFVKALELAGLPQPRADTALHCDSKTQQITGGSGVKCRTSAGQLYICTDGLPEMTVKEAQELIGCEWKSDADGMTVSFPFASARLIVRSEHQPELYGGTLAASGYRDVHVIQFPDAAGAYEAYKKYRSDAGILSAEPDRSLTASAIDPSDYPWGTAEIGADSYCAWLKSVRDSLPEIRAAVLDTGIYAGHSWFAERLLPGACFVPGSDGTTNDRSGHGTHCAGILAASTPENVKLLPLKILGDDGVGSTLSLYCGMMYAIEQGAQVLNMSLGGNGESPLIDEAVRAAAEAGAICVAAAGNEAEDAIYHCPASSENVITVSAVNSEHFAAAFSNFGADVDFCAPGVAIRSAVPGGRYDTELKDGTSMAAPFAAAAVADLLSYDPTLTYDEIYSLLRANAVDYGTPGRDGKFGWGEISLHDFHFAADYCDAPQFSPESGEYENAVTVRISCTAENAMIYYTTDGTAPDLSSEHCLTGTELEFPQSVRIRAIAAADGILSAESAAEYCIDGKETAQPFVVKDGTLLSYQGVMKTVDAAAAFPGDTLSAVGNHAFAGSLLAETVKLPANIASIGESAFANCKKLKEVTAEGAVDIGAEAFAGCPVLRAVTLGTVSCVGDGAFRGCVKLSTLTPGFSDSLEELPAHLFHGCRMLAGVSLPPVTRIGDYALAGCEKLSFDYHARGFFWENVTEIGAHALENCGFPDFVKLTGLREIGAYAFASSAVTTAILPDSLDALPDGTFRDCPSLRYFRARGLTQIGSYALMNAADRRAVLDLDFAALTQVGTAGLAGLYAHEPIRFSALTSFGERAFDGAAGEALYFPAVKTLPAGAFSGTDCALLGFENLENAAADAVSGAKAVAVGAAFVNAADGAFSADLLAGPRGSPLAYYANKHSIPYRVTPALLTGAAEIHTAAGNAAPLTALALGFGALHTVWYAEDGTVLQDSCSAQYFADTQIPGTRQLRAVLSDGKNPLAEEKFTLSVTGTEVDSPDTILPEEMQILHWKRDAGAGIIPTDSSGNYVQTRRYLPEQNGNTRLILSKGACKALISGSDGTQYQLTGSQYRDRELAFYANSGVAYTISLTVTQDELRQNRIAVQGVRLTLRDPANAVYLVPSWHSKVLNPELHAGDAAANFEMQVKTLNPDGSLSAAEIVRCDIGSGAAGDAQLYAFGVGDFCGGAVLDYQIDGVLTESAEMPVHTKDKGSASVRFTPEETACYTVFTDYLPQWLEAQCSAGVFDPDAWLQGAEFTVYDAAGSQIGTSDITLQYGFCAAQLTLQAGKTYRIAVTQTWDTEVSPIALYAVRDADFLAKHGFGYENAADSTVLSDSAAEPPVVNADQLREGVDFTLTYLSNDRPGKMAAVVRGLGVCRGTVLLPMTLLGGLQEAESAAVSGLFSEYQFVPESDGSYLFYTDYTEVGLQALLADYAPEKIWNDSEALLSVSDASGVLRKGRSSYRGFAKVEVALRAGNVYTVQVRCGKKPEEGAIAVFAECGRLPLTDAGCTAADTVYRTDRLNPPVPTLEFDEMLLENGRDYTVDAPDCGTGDSVLVIRGKGKYRGTLLEEYTVVAAAFSDAPVMLEPDVPFVCTEQSAEYRFMLYQSDAVQLVSADGSLPLYSVCYFEADGNAVYTAEGEEPVQLFFGEYVMQISFPEADSRRLMLRRCTEGTELSSCAIAAEPAVCTGEPLRPRLTVYDGETRLLAGWDFITLTEFAPAEPGQYLIRLRGIGRYTGDAYCVFTVLPAEQSSLPLLHEGTQSAEIAEPGQTVFYRWKPGQTACLLSDQPQARIIRVFDGSRLLTEICGIDSLYTAAEAKPGREYLVAASYYSSAETGAIPLTVQTDFRELCDCTAEYDTLLPFDAAGAVPEFTLRDGDTVLQEGKDYTVRYVGGEMHCGRAEILLDGIGRYCGSCALQYCIRPADYDSWVREMRLAPKKLTCGEEVSEKRGQCGSAALYSFTAPADGMYYLQLSDSGVTALLYRQDGEWLPPETESAELRAGEQLSVIVLTDWLEAEYGKSDKYSLCVAESPEPLTWTDEENGVTYRITGETAEAAEIAENRCGAWISDTVPHPNSGVPVQVSGMDAALAERCRDTLTLYCTPGGSADRLLTELGLCRAYTSSDSTLPGDVTGTGAVSADDAETLLRWLTEGRGMRMSFCALRAADFDRNGTVDLFDVRAILASLPAQDQQASQ